MTCALDLLAVSGVLSVQDMGRPGHLAQGLSRGGAMDRLALIEAAALLALPAPVACIEMAGAGGTFATRQPMRVALTGAPMRADLDGQPISWNATHLLCPGQRLRIGPAEAGLYGYLTPAGGVLTPEWLGSRAAHLAIGVGAPLTPGASLPCGADQAPDTAPRRITPAPRCAGGTLRLIDGPQTPLFAAEELEAFLAAGFHRGARGNRQGVALDAPRRFQAAGALALTGGLASDVIGPGDVQLAGDGIPYVLMAECQTIGGYPRIGTVLPDDLPRLAQATPGTPLRFVRLTPAQARAAHIPEAAQLRAARARVGALVRDPSTIPDLLSYNLISGVVRGDET
ncbi:MAG: biotin-dependent carboxyltransferase family protein [Paracoccus sp. (in: a-proteobacteria)]